MLGHRVNVNDDHVRQKEFLIIPDARIQGTAACTRCSRADRKTHFLRGTRGGRSDVYEAEFIS